MPIYFMRSIDETGPIKIGWALNPKKRLKAIQTMSPRPLKILGIMPGSKKIEGKVHRYFSKYRLHGEWFDACQPLIDFISNPKLPTTAPKPRKLLALAYTFRIYKDTLEGFRQASRERNISSSLLLRKLITKFLEEEINILE